MKHFNIYDFIPGMDKLNQAAKDSGWMDNMMGGQGDIWHTVSATLILLLVMVGSLMVFSRYQADRGVLPDKGFTLRNLFEFAVESLYGMVESMLGPKQAKMHFPILGATFVYVFLNNLLGLIPGFPPATSTLANNVAPAATIFLYYNIAGFREHGVGYLKQFMGPLLALAWLMIPIELIGHLVRPVSLSLRLAGNMTGDHMVLGIFTDLTYVGVPIVFLGLGLFICFVQAFVFTLLSSVYVSMAVSHDH